MSNLKSNQENEVLFQKLGNVWYVFTESEGEMIYSTLPEDVNPHNTKLELFEVIEEHMKKVAKQTKRDAEIAA